MPLVSFPTEPTLVVWPRQGQRVADGPWKTGHWRPAARVGLLLCALVPFLATGAWPAEDVWLDIDTSIGLPQGEVDDGLALVQAFHSPELTIHGISVVFGNTTLEKAVPIARDITRRFGPAGIGVWAGASRAAQLGEETEAVRELASALKKRPLTVLALAPVTNVASLMRLHPDLVPRIRSIVMVAARRPGQRFVTGSGATPHRDFNFELDPAAMQVLLDSAVPLVFAPWEVSSQVWIRQADLARLVKSGPSGRYLAEACGSWIALWKERFGVDGFNPFDTLAVGWVSHPHLIRLVEVGVWIEDREDDRRPGATKPYLLVDPERHDGRRAAYAYAPEAGFQPLLLERLSAHP